MQVPSLRLVLGAAALLILTAPQGLKAQAAMEPSQMPQRTLFYLTWRGLPDAEIRKNNSLLSLWDDPGIAPLRVALAQSMFQPSADKPGTHKMTPEEAAEFTSLLENSFTLGYISETPKHAAARAAAADAKPPAWNGLFMVYDRTGKEAILLKTLLRRTTDQKDAPVLSQVTIAGLSVLKREGKTDTSYVAETGKYAVATSDRGVMEEILTRLTGTGAAPPSLAQTSAYQEAKPNLGGGLIEFFLGVPEVKQLASESKAGPVPVSPLLDAARLDSVHSISGHIAFEGAKTHMQAAILGDASAGTLFDIWGEGMANPSSLAFVPADTVSYTAGLINLQGIYKTVKRVMRATMPQAQQGNVDIFETIAAQKLGMPVSAALDLLTGEFATVQTSPVLDPDKQIYFFAIRKKPETLKLLHSLLSDQISSERAEGDVTFLKISLGGSQSAAGTAQWKFFHLAVTPEAVIGTSRAENLREFLNRRAGAASQAGLASVPRFQSLRAQFPSNLNSITYVDLQKVDWQGLRDRWVAEAKKTETPKSVAPIRADSAKQLPLLNFSDLLQLVDTKAFSRHLHYSSGTSWKDAHGVHIEQWTE